MSGLEPILIEATPYADDRGFFVELYNRVAFDDVIGSGVEFVQDNLSSSRRNVLRGLHYQLPPHAQGKLVRVSRGKIFDVAVDVRRSSKDYGKWWGFEMDSESLEQLWVPPGFAHGFLALSDRADVIYKVTAHHAPGSERSILWDDPDIGIDWPLEGIDPIVSERDGSAPNLAAAEVFD